MQTINNSAVVTSEFGSYNKIYNFKTLAPFNRQKVAV